MRLNKRRQAVSGDTAMGMAADSGSSTISGNGSSQGSPLPGGGPVRRDVDVSPNEFLNRELSWLEFNRRVLHEAIDERTPLLERLRFLSIFSSNLDEFIMKRAGGLKRQVAASVVSLTPDGLTPAQQLAAIRRTLLPMLAQQAAIYTDAIRPELATKGVHLLSWNQLTPEEKTAATLYFRQSVFPVLTPLAVDPGHPFPFISNLSTSLGVTLRRPDAPDERLFARVKVPAVLPAWISVTPGIPGTPGGGDTHRYVSLLDIIRHNLADLFPEMVVVNMMPFRVTRNADVERDEEDAEDLLDLIEREVRQRRFEKAVRLEHGPNPEPWMRSLLMQELELTENDVYELPAELDFARLDTVANVNIPPLRYEPWTPLVPHVLSDEEHDIFSIIQAGDVLVHHPYESFAASVERFVRAAAADPKVMAIKMTLYRAGDDNPFVRTLIRAAESGKQVACLVEVKARFDEERNVQLAQSLEDAGVHVVYGIVGLKTHCKTILVVREEPGGLRCYAHIGTGNYHPGNAKLYTDLGLFTCDPQITADLVDLFHFLTGRSLKRDYRSLLVAPVNMKHRFEEMIEREVAHHRAGRPAAVIAKMNAFEHRGIARELYAGSKAGMPTDLIVRGFCCLRPGVPGLSENIRVISVIGRFLEHSRIFYFRNGAADPVDGEFYIGSADWMYRNLLSRVEAITPIIARPLRQTCWNVLQTLLNDQRQAWDMQPDGTYIQRTPADAAASVGTHATFMHLARPPVTLEGVQVAPVEPA